MDLTGYVLEIHMRTDANNLVTTASSTHLPEQKETIHMINQLRTEACSGAIDDLAHVASNDCLSDCLTKSSAKAEFLINAVNTGCLPNVDRHPPFRELMRDRHNAYNVFSSESSELISWIVNTLDDSCSVLTFMNIPVRSRIEQHLTTFTGVADFIISG